MGADIFVFVEQNLGGTWRLIADEDWLELGISFDDDSDDPWPIYFGKAGQMDAQNFWSVLDEWPKPIDQRCDSDGLAARGLPNDVSEAIRQKVGDSDFGASWVLLQELIEFPWDREVQYNALVDASNFKEYRAGKRFSCHKKWLAKGVSETTLITKGRKVVSYQEMSERIVSGTVPPNYYTLIEFSNSFSAFGEMIRRYTIPRLSLLGSPHHVRVVFWFSY